MYYNITDIYDEAFLSIISPVMHYTSIITIIFTVILIFIIIKKTPKQMKSFQAYLLPYIFNALMLETIMLLFKPILLHPYFAVISVGSWIKHSQETSIIMMILMLYFAMSLVDCIAGMSAERYYAVRNKEVLGHSKTPQIIFGILFASNLAFVVLALCAALISDGKEGVIMSYHESFTFFTEHVKGSEKVLDFSSILLLRTDKQNMLIYGAIGFLFFAFARYLTASAYLVLNATTSLKSSTTISQKLQKNNKMLLRCTYIQFAGFILLAGLPTVLIVYALFAISEPTKLTTYCILAMNSFGLYDTFVTIICIKPYRMFFVNLFRKRVPKESSYGIRTARITSVPSIL